MRRQLLIKDVKVFLRDVSQWVQLLPLLALVLLYLYNFSVLDLDRVPFMSGVIKNFYAFVNLGMAGFVIATVAVRFVFPAVSAEGNAFWIVRTSPVSLRDFLWSKFWIGLLPVLLFTETLTVAANEFLGVDPFLKIVAAVTIVLMTFALVGLATGLGARYPRFGADPDAGSRLVRRRGVHDSRRPLHPRDHHPGRLAFLDLHVQAGARRRVEHLGPGDHRRRLRRHRGVGIATWLIAMRFGVNGLESMSRR